MASSEDFQSIYALNKKQGVPKGISIVNFCHQNGIVYSQFERWFKSRKQSANSSVHPIRIVDKDGLLSSGPQADADGPGDWESVKPKESVLRFGITVRTNQGLSVQQNNLTYRQLLRNYSAKVRQ